MVIFETSDRQVVDAAARPVAQQDAQTSKSQTSVIISCRLVWVRGLYILPNTYIYGDQNNLTMK